MLSEDMFQVGKHVSHEASDCGNLDKKKRNN